MFEIWRFITDPESRGLTAGWAVKGLPPSAKEVSLPHTVNIEEGLEEYRGPMWYSCRFEAEGSFIGQDVVFRSGGIYRDAEFWLNGILIARHYDSGFSPFSIRLDPAIQEGENLLVIRVDGSFSTKALPIDRSFDWADDGGMIRGVSLEVIPKEGIHRAHIAARPKIGSYGERVVKAPVEIEVTADAGTVVEIYDGTELLAEGPVGESFLVPEMRLWHFDDPKLYRAVVMVLNGSEVIHRKEITFGAREFITEGPRFALNGEYVRLCGVEWMPGSNPSYGNAEPVIYLKKILKQLKEANCVFTRFHWQQDDAVYDWCDRHGMLVQEEIPNWGGRDMDEHLLGVSRRQAEEMVLAHGNHPSIVSWGIGNEMRGQEENTKQFLTAVRDTFRALDPDRLVNYVSNSWWSRPATDAVRLGDSMWINEYFGTWVQGRDLREDMDALIEAEPDLPIVISEFGVCEPVFPGGDEACIKNLVEKMALYRTYPQISATVHFSLNDYRTQMGEEGEGKLRRRVHGSTDIYGKTKPSYAVLQKESAPVTVEETEGQLTVTCRSDLPCHAVIGYYIKTAEGKTCIPDLLPGRTVTLPISGGYTIHRPNGDLIL